jgi:hypothetical protein
MQRRKCARAVSYSVAVLLGGLVAFGGDARAGKSQIISGFGQYVAGRANNDDTGFIIFNPTNLEMIGLAIEFDAADGAFNNCQGALFEPFGTDDDFIQPSGDEGSDSAGLFLVISVPTTAEGSRAGKIKSSFGLFVLGATKSDFYPSLNPKVFALHPDPTEQAAELAACCTEIENLGQPENIFKKFFRTSCPEFD